MANPKKPPLSPTAKYALKAVLFFWLVSLPIVAAQSYSEEEDIFFYVLRLSEQYPGYYTGGVLLYAGILYYFFFCRFDKDEEA